MASSTRLAHVLMFRRIFQCVFVVDIEWDEHTYESGPFGQIAFFVVVQDEGTKEFKFGRNSSDEKRIKISLSLEAGDDMSSVTDVGVKQEGSSSKKRSARPKAAKAVPEKKTKPTQAQAVKAVTNRKKP